METKFVGIDVNKRVLDFDCLPVSAGQQFANDADGIAALVALLQGSGVERIVIEATGGYETAVASALAVAGLPVVVVNPKQVRDFAILPRRIGWTPRCWPYLANASSQRYGPSRTRPSERWPTY